MADQTKETGKDFSSTSSIAAPRAKKSPLDEAKIANRTKSQYVSKRQSPLLLIISYYFDCSIYKSLLFFLQGV